MNCFLKIIIFLVFFAAPVAYGFEAKFSCRGLSFAPEETDTSDRFNLVLDKSFIITEKNLTQLIYTEALGQNKYNVYLSIVPDSIGNDFFGGSFVIFKETNGNAKKIFASTFPSFTDNGFEHSGGTITVLFKSSAESTDHYFTVNCNWAAKSRS